jgi:CheY-like chemotaxis protein
MTKTILLAEDSPDDIALFMQVMVKSGRNNPVIVVRDGDEAIAYLKGEGKFSDREKFPVPSILMLDLKMPRVSGFQVLEWIRQQPQFSYILLVVISHYGETAEINRAYELGAHSFLTKPFSHTDLDNLASHYRIWWENNVQPR